MTIHIVNGDSTKDMLRHVGITAPIIVWRDVLHDGRVISVNDPKFDEIRANFLADTVSLVMQEVDRDTEYHTILEDFSSRRKQLTTLADFDEIVLWFEHDLYDQLQLLEVLFENNVKSHDNVNLVSIDAHPEVQHFHGFGNLTPEQLSAVGQQKKVTLTKKCREQANKIWSAFLAKDPNELVKYLEPVEELPYLNTALNRYFGEFPNKETGLTDTQHRLLNAIENPASELRYLRYCLGLTNSSHSVEAVAKYDAFLRSLPTFKRIFWQLQDDEPAPFMGDLCISKELNQLINQPEPLLELIEYEHKDNVYQLTQFGKDILKRSAHWTDKNVFDYWRGGVHVSTQTPWQWDSIQRSFVN